MLSKRLNWTELLDFATEVFCRVGFQECDSQTAANVLIWASLRGVDTHGIRNLVPYYVDNVRSGEIDPNGEVVVEFETPNSVRLNGGSTTGLVSAKAAMEFAISKAVDNGIGIGTVRNSHHLGPAGYYAHLAMERGMLGFCATGHFFGKGHDVGVAPINGLRALFSTNPFALAAPCGTKPPFLLDMSTAVATVNRIETFEQAGAEIPVGWAKDSAGAPTLDAAVAKILYPLGGDVDTGGHKGVGLSMMVSILSGVLSGAWSQIASDEEFHQPTMGHMVGAIRIDQFMPREQFGAAMDAFVGAIQSGNRLDPKQPIHYPGSQEHETERSRRENGIPIDQRLRSELRVLARSLGIDTTLFDE